MIAACVVVVAPEAGTKARDVVALQTVSLSVTLGMACSFYQPAVVLEAVALTAGVVSALTAYAFYATRKGRDFRCALCRLLHGKDCIGSSRVLFLSVHYELAITNVIWS